MVSIKNITQRFLLVIREVFDFFDPLEEVSILCYHSISDDENETTIDPEAFEKQLVMLQRSGVQFVSLQEVVAWVKGDASLPQKSVALTFDDGYADFETTALPILEKYNAPATVFVVGDEAAARAYLGNDTLLLSAEAIVRLRAHSLVEIGYHSTTHANLARLASGELAAEVTSPFPVRFFAYPGGNHSPEVAEALQEGGYEAACTIGWNLVKKGSDTLHIPRSVILKDMPLWRVRFATTRALLWYRALTRFLK